MAWGIKLDVKIALKVLGVILAVSLRVKVGVGVEHFCCRERRIT